MYIFKCNSEILSTQVALTASRCSEKTNTLISFAQHIFNVKDHSLTCPQDLHHYPLVLNPLDRRVLKKITAVRNRIVGLGCHQRYSDGHDRRDDKRHDKSDHAALRVEAFGQNEPVEAAHEFTLRNHATNEDGN
ncbi:unnamed protein product [Phytophthora fragariaefolia]|uniref:Unnamed protein product n=1 Tax=Phytophthora fragariaefolia TaxID=1490495 RepID=A0A9W6X9F1_9STRA|nr:unnamed protein product [Phytophthora fragariaefolia]